MKIEFIRKEIVIGLIILLIGAGFFPSALSHESKKKSLLMSMNSTWIVDDEDDGDYASIQEAIDNASPGDIIEVYSGTYSGNISIDKQLNLVGIESEFENGSDKGKPIVDGEGKYSGFVVNADGCILSGFKVTNCNMKLLDADSAIIVYSNNSEISYNDISDADNGISVFASTDNIIFRNNISSCVWAIMLGYSFYNLVSENLIYGSDEMSSGGISISFYSKGNNISKNIISNMIFAIFFQGPCRENIVYNNQLEHSGYGIMITASNKNRIEHNNFIENMVDAIFITAFNNKWDGNYWMKWNRDKPKLIFGLIGGGFLFVPWVNFDRNPAQEPYDIS